MSPDTAIADFGVGFTQVGGGPWRLLGSGTLVTDGSAHAILTTRQVADLLPDEGRVGITLRSDLNQITIPRTDLDLRALRDRPGWPDNDALTAIALSQEAKERIGAVKQFYDLSTIPTPPTGAWFIQGFSNELVVTDLPLDCFDLIYSFDSVVFPVQPTARPDVARLSARGGPPSRLQGLRGGGIWQVDPDDQSHAMGVTLRGVVSDVDSDTAEDALVKWAHCR
jgi:hypothetical protein